MRIASGINVFVDGVKVCDVVKFNIAEAWVECVVTSPSGYCNQDASGGEFLKSRLYGHIEIEEIK